MGTNGYNSSVAGSIPLVGTNHEGIMNEQVKPNEHQKQLNIKGTREFIARLLATGRAFDVNKDGLYDARSGAINVWCSPTDKPACWTHEITKGDLKYPREYVGGLYWDWLDDNSVQFRLDCTPYQMLEHIKKERKPRWNAPILTDDEWNEIVGWLERKVLELLRLADLHPEIGGTKCPFCDYVLPPDELLNTIIEHIDNMHREVEVTGVCLGREACINTKAGDYVLRAVEKF